jgi:hypothetical protein
MTQWQRAIAAVVLETEFHVTEKEYQLGRPTIGSCCPIALAIREALQTNSIISICAATIRVDSVWFITPKIVDDYIKAFDRRDDDCYLLDFRVSEMA